MSVQPALSSAPATDDALARITPCLTELLGDRFTAAKGVRDTYARGESYPHAFPPDAMAFPMSTEEVAKIVAICAAERIPMIASGAATSLEGHITAPFGGIGINMTRMDRLLAVNRDDLDCRVQAGVTREALNHALRDEGLFFPIDPGANATIGGMAATRASGTNAVRYGTMMTNVLGLTVVRPDGTVIRTGGAARKSAAGYDLTRLYVGSEGTLGLITEVRLRLHGIPETIAAATCAFATLEGAVSAVTQLIQYGLPLARVELLDETQVRASNAYSRLDLPERPHLFLEFHGSRGSVDEQIRLAAEIFGDHGGEAFAHAVSTEERTRLWTARHNAYFAAMALRPGAVVWSSDVCVPISQLARTIVTVREDIDANGLLAPIVGHVGDGNFHILFAIDPADRDERTRAGGVYDRMIDRAIAVGGSCTGEHGIGLMKRKHMVSEHGEAAIATMRAIKAALDPLNLFNPGKMLPGD